MPQDNCRVVRTPSISTVLSRQAGALLCYERRANQFLHPPYILDLQLF
ncbi:MAG: hypothetical protein ACFFCZ_29715 [Promethearchaeota archaeon]